MFKTYVEEGSTEEIFSISLIIYEIRLLNVFYVQIYILYTQNEPCGAQSWTPSMHPFQFRILCDGDSVILKNVMVDRGEMQRQGGTDLDFLFFMVSICPSEFLHRGGHHVVHATSYKRKVLSQW